MTTHQKQNDKALLYLTAPLGTGTFKLDYLRAEEEISKPFEYEVILVSENANLDFDTTLGKSATVVLEVNKKKRYFNGIIGSVQQRESLVDHKTTTYRIVLYPKLWLLKYSKNYRIFQNKSALTIIKDVLKETGVENILDKTVKAKSQPAREYCVQYAESNFDFINRLMEEEGIFYFFKHENSKHTMVLADQCSACETVPNVTEYPLDMREAKYPHLNTIQYCELQHQMVPKTYSLTDYNYTTAKTSLFSKATGKGKGGDVYSYPGQYDQDYKPTKSISETYASIESQRQESPRDLLLGRSTAVHFEVGKKFKLIGHARRDANAEYIIEKLIQEVWVKAEEQPHHPLIKNEFIGFKSDVQYRPPLITPKPMIHGSQTALVTGPEKEEIWTDKYGRIKVKFHWDQDKEKNEKTTCWVRVSQGWAASNWGILFTPRIGMEVVVSFINGDPDRPLVTGCVYNNDNMPPYLPDIPTKSTIKTNSVKAKKKGFNELRFEDKALDEEIYMHAQKDFNTHVLENRCTWVENGSDYKMIERGDRDVEIKGVAAPAAISKKKRAESLKMSGESVSHKGDDNLTLHTGSRTMKLLAKAAGQGDYIIQMTRGDRKLTIDKGHEFVTLHLGNQTFLLNKGNRETTLMMGNDALSMMKGNKTLTMMEGNQTQTMMKGNYTTTMFNGNRVFMLLQGNVTHTQMEGNHLITLGNGNQVSVINGSKMLTVSKPLVISGMGGMAMTIMGNSAMTFGGVAQIQGQQISITAAQTLSITAPQIMINGMMINVNAGGAMKLSAGGMMDMEAGASANLKAGAMINVQGGGVVNVKGALANIGTMVKLGG